jgi:hypothetical protein
MWGDRAATAREEWGSLHFIMKDDEGDRFTSLCKDYEICKDYERRL